jgi:flagellar hook protein FlgE
MMGVYSSMSTAISGLTANGEMLGVISDNIVNANTTGFKASRGEFQNILAQDLLATGTGAQIGRGTSMNGVTNIFTQGAVSRTERTTDLALSGNGFFILKGDTFGYTYTRDGSFRFDKDGWLTNLNGYRVQAYEATPEGFISGKLGDIRLPYSTIPARATKQVEMHVNLDARMPSSVVPFDQSKPDETAQFTTGTQVYDSVGNAHAVQVYFNRTDANTWEWTAMTDAGNLAGGEKGVPGAIANGQLMFDQDGKLLSSNQNLINTTFANGAIPDQELQFNFGDPQETGGTGQRGTTMYGSKNATFRNVQDGFSAGNLADVAIDSFEGVMSGTYTNGQVKTLAQIAVSRFESTERLSKVGDNQFRETIASGQPLIGKPNTNGRGTVMTKSLEQSNVDLAHEFVEMIRAQRGFQASAKTITTGNEMLDEIINLQRR